MARQMERGNTRKGKVEQNWRGWIERAGGKSQCVEASSSMPVSFFHIIVVYVRTREWGRFGRQVMPGQRWTARCNRTVEIQAHPGKVPEGESE